MPIFEECKYITVYRDGRERLLIDPHLASWWPLRHEGLADFVHYNDLNGRWRDVLTPARSAEHARIRPRGHDSIRR